MERPKKFEEKDCTVDMFNYLNNTIDSMQLKIAPLNQQIYNLKQENKRLQSKKFVHLSSKSAGIVYQWAEINSNNPLSKTYMDACCVLGGIDRKGNHDELQKYWRPGNHDYIKFNTDLTDKAYILRDTIGRVILEHIKRIEKRARK